MFGPSPAEVVSPSQYANMLQTSLCHAFSAVRENLATAPRPQKDNYDKLVHGKAFQPGDLVWLHNTAVPTRQSRKLHCPWNGPQRVLQCLYECTYRIHSLHVSMREQIGTNYSQGQHSNMLQCSDQHIK